MLFPKCPWIGAGLINEADYDNYNCDVCQKWQDDEYTLANCAADLGWTSPLDFVVFPLHSWAPDLLATVRDPATWIYPINQLVATDVAQDWLTRWDGFEVPQDPPQPGIDLVAYSQHWTCWGVMLLPTLALINLAALVLAYLPTSQLLKVLAALLNLIVRAIGTFAFLYFFLLYSLLRTASRIR